MKYLKRVDSLSDFYTFGISYVKSIIHDRAAPVFSGIRHSSARSKQIVFFYFLLTTEIFMK